MGLRKKFKDVFGKDEEPTLDTSQLNKGGGDEDDKTAAPPSDADGTDATVDTSSTALFSNEVVHAASRFTFASVDEIEPF